MSGKLMEWAVEVPTPLSLATRLVLVYLARIADDDGGNCYPSLDTISGAIQANKVTVSRAITDLRKCGLVTLEQRGGRTASNRYRVNRDASLSVGLNNRAERSEALLSPRLNNQPQKGEKGVKKPGLFSVRLTDSKESSTLQETPSLKVRQRELALVRLIPEVTADAPVPLKKQSEPKAIRLWPEWQPSQSDAEFARGLGLNPDDVAAEFKDYWLAKPGQIARKLGVDGWSRTYKNRCRALASRPRASIVRRSQPTSAEDVYERALRAAGAMDDRDHPSQPQIGGLLR